MYPFPFITAMVGVCVVALMVIVEFLVFMEVFENESRPTLSRVFMGAAGFVLLYEIYILAKEVAGWLLSCM